jgi:tetratricopeptide (TPR) repeat protein
MADMKMKWVDCAIGPALGAIALAVYMMSLSTGAFPGASAMLVVSQLGLYPSLSPASPLYGAVAHGISAVAGMHAEQALNLFSALCASLAVWLLYSLMRRGVYFFTEEYQATEARRRVAAVIAGGSAAVFLAFCVPFWSVANRAHTAAFDIFLLLLLARLFTGYAAGGKPVTALALALLYGAGMAEFASLIVFAPLFGGGMLYVMWQRETLRGWLPAAMAGMLILGLLTYAAAAAAFFETPGYSIRGYRSFMQILWFMWRDQYFLIARSLPREGWLVILFVTVVPWMAMFASARRALNDERDWGVYILHAIMTALVVAIAMNAPLSPWTMLGWRRLLVTPYVLSAMVFGYLAAFWFLLPGPRRESGWTLDFGMVRLVIGRTVLAGMLATALWVSWRNAQAVDTRVSRTVNAMAGKIVECLDGRTWLITDGRLDNHLLLAARRQGVPLRVLNLQSGGSTLYLDYVASLFDDIRLKNMAKLSLPALLREWLTPESGIATQVAALAFPDIWQRYGFQALPNRLVFLGSTAVNAETASALVQQHEAFWKEFEPWLAAQAGGGDWTTWAHGHAGMIANNLGVLLEDHGLSGDAFRTYGTARRLAPDNVSALLNMSAMVRGGRAADENGSVEKAIRQLEEGMEQKYHIWSLSRHYGIVRAPEAFAQLGWTWAYSGRPEMAIDQMERATELLPDEQKSSMQGMMADLYLMDNRPLEGEAIYKVILSRDPGNLPALQGMIRIALMQKDCARAEEYRQQAAKHGLDPAQAILQQALIETVAGQFQPARERLEALLQEDRRLLRGWVLLAEIGFATKDERLIAQVLRRLEGIEGAQGFHGAMLRGRIAFEKQDLAAAADFFEAALVHQPGSRRIIEMLLRLDLALARGDSIRRHVQALLQEDPGHALALYVRGSLQIADGDPALAEDSLRQSLRRERLPMSLNDLAWLLAERGVYDEAEGLINEALAMNDRQPAAWDTKGVILLRTGRVEEAESAFGRSIALFGNNPGTHLHMGEAQLSMGKKEAVQIIVDRIQPYREQLPPRERELFNRLREAIR